MQAVILAGGLGTRLGALTAETPKPLLPVGGRPFLAWLLDVVGHAGCSDVLVSAGHLGGQIEAALAGRTGVEVAVEPEPLGTGGALRFLRDRLQPRFLLLNGDSLFHVDLRAFLAATTPEAAACLALRRVPDASRYGAVTLHGARVTAFEERAISPGPGLINGGVAVVSRAAIEQLPIDRPASLERDLWPVLAAEGRLGGIELDGPFIDIGVPADYERAQTFVPAALGRDAVA